MLKRLVDLKCNKTKRRSKRLGFFLIITGAYTLISGLTKLKKNESYEDRKEIGHCHCCCSCNKED